eukprot:scaffold11692_cov97-Isochrysis_galbana.AAC.2
MTCQQLSHHSKNVPQHRTGPRVTPGGIGGGERLRQADERLEGAGKGKDVGQLRGSRRRQCPQHLKRLVAHHLPAVVQQRQDTAHRGGRTQQGGVGAIGRVGQQPLQQRHPVEPDVEVGLLHRRQRRRQVGWVGEEHGGVVFARHAAGAGLVLVGGHADVAQVDQRLQRIARQLRVLVMRQRHQQADAALVDQPKRLGRRQLLEGIERFAPVVQLRGRTEPLEQLLARRLARRAAPQQRAEERGHARRRRYQRSTPPPLRYHPTLLWP